MRVLSITLEDKKLVWFEKSNRYVRMEEPAFDVFSQLYKSNTADAVAEWFSEKYEIPLLEAITFVDEVKQFIEAANQSVDPIAESSFPDNSIVPSEENIYTTKQYNFSGTNLIFEYGHERIERMIHPMMAHLEVKLDENFGHTFKLFRKDDLLYLYTDGKYVGQWKISDRNYFKGKIFLECLNKAYQKKEQDWMAMLHASAVSNGESALLFAGNSGSGKSTILSILVANGFEFLTDDFVPVDSASRNIFPFPVAISVKEGAFKVLSKKFPELKHAHIYDYEYTGKRVKYLSPPNASQQGYQGTHVKGIVFVDYRPGTILEFEKISKHDAIQRMVNESWISPQYENVDRFLNWFIKLPCYRLVYSDSDLMIAKVQKLFKDEL